MDIVEILHKIGFEWQIALANFVNFLVVFIILKLFVFGPVQKIIKNRKEKIDQGLEDAETAKMKLSLAEEDASKIKDQAKENAAVIIDDAKHEGSIIKNRIEELAYKKEAEIIEQGHQNVKEERNKMMQDVQGSAADLISDAITQILAEEITEKKHHEYSDKVVNLIKNRS